MTEDRHREGEAIYVKADLNLARHPCREFASGRGSERIDLKHSLSGLQIVSINICDAPRFGDRHAMGTSVDESHRIARTHVSFGEHSHEITNEPDVLDRDRKTPVPEARPNLVARCARLGDLDDTCPNLEDIAKVNVGFDETGDREVLCERARRGQVKTAFTPVCVVLERVHQDRHVRTAMVFVDVFISGKSKFAQPE